MRAGRAHALRLRAQLLSGPPARDPVAVVERLLAVQGQDPRGLRLAVRARSAGLSAADVERALTEDRTLVVTWVNRGTLHLVRSEDLPWLHALTTPPLRVACDSRLAREGVTPAAATRGVAAVVAALADEGPLDRAVLAERVGAAAGPLAGRAALHVLFRATLDGHVVRGPMAGKQHRYVLVRDWLGAELGPVDRDRALAELARRFLAGHGPAGDRDLARWAGLPLRDARAGLSAIAAELVGAGPAGVELAARSQDGPVRLPSPRLLGAFDPVLLGWDDRTPVVGPHAARITIGGMFVPFALVGGTAAGTWRLQRGRVDLRPLAPLSPAAERALERDAADVQRYLGLGT